MIENKVVLITGVSSGIGQETAQLVAKRGARVFGTVRDRRPAEAIAGVELVRMDVADESSVAEAVQSVLRQAGQIHVLVNNAGYALAGALEETSVQEAREQFETNFFARIVYRALTARSPRLRYPVGEGVLLSRLRRFVPAGIFDKSFRKQFRLDDEFAKG